MTTKEALSILIDFQKYRRDNNVPAKYPMPVPKLIGEAIDVAISVLKKKVEKEK